MLGIELGRRETYQPKNPNEKSNPRLSYIVSHYQGSPCLFSFIIFNNILIPANHCYTNIAVKASVEKIMNTPINLILFNNFHNMHIVLTNAFSPTDKGVARVILCWIFSLALKICIACPSADTIYRATPSLSSSSSNRSILWWTLFDIHTLQYIFAKLFVHDILCSFRKARYLVWFIA